MNIKHFSPQIIKILKNGGVGIIPTDTLYGIVGSALNKKTVARIYRLKRRNPKKPFIILIGSVNDLKKFNISLQPTHYSLLTKFWPAKTSIIFFCPSSKFKYLHRGAKSLAFRIPKSYKLKTFLKATGPLVAPSANPEGESPAKTIPKAKEYFGGKLNFYIDAGKKISKPSRLIKFTGMKIKELRK